MTAIIIPSRRLRQPTSDGRIRTDGIGLGIGGVFSAIGGRINLKGVLPTSNSGTRRPGIHGMGVSYSTQSTIFPNGTIPALAGNPYTIGFLFSLRTLSQYSGLFSYQPGTTLYGIEVRLGLGVSDSDLWWRQGTNAGYNYFGVGAGTFAANTADNRLVLSSSGRVEDPVTVILNGRVLTATKAGTTTGNIEYFTGNICYGSRTEGTTFLDGVIYQSPFWNRRLSIAEAMEWCAYPWSIYQSASRRIYFDLAGGSTARTATLSLEAAVQASRSATAGIDAGVQRGISATSSIEAAISRALTATASLESAIRAALTATTSVDSYVQAGSTATASLDAAIRRALSATASLDSGIQLARSASATIDSAIQRALSATASLDGYVQAGTTVSVSLDSAIRYARVASASLDSAISLARTATASMDADIVVAAAGTVTANLDAALAATSTAVSALDSAVRWARAATATMDGYIYDSAAVEAEGYTFKATARPSFRATRRVVQ